MLKERTLQQILSAKQFRIAPLVAAGIKNCEIAMILRTTENVIKNIIRDVYDISGCSNRVQLALLLVHEHYLDMYELNELDRQIDALRQLICGVDEDLAVDLS